VAHDWLVIQTRVSRHVVQRTHCTSLQVGSTKHHGAHAGIDDGACTHGARLQRHIQGAVIQPPRTDLLRSCLQRQNLCMCSGVGQLLTLITSTGNHCTVANNHRTNTTDAGAMVTRMSIGADGFGYALTNDARHLIRFTTGGLPVIEDLGSLVDDPNNNGQSVHLSCTSFGGDMIADDKGNLYLMTSAQYIFKINIESKIATYLGTLKGLPVGYSINGMAVTEKNQILVSSAVQAGYFLVDPSNWTAVAMPVKETSWNSSDLANSNVLRSNPTPAITQSKTDVRLLGKGSMAVYPNPAPNHEFQLRLRNLTPGGYQLEVTDMMGRQVMSHSIQISQENSTLPILLPKGQTQGLYLIKLSGTESRESYMQKLLIQ